MSRENVELVLSMYEAVERMDTSAAAAWTDDLVWDMSNFELPDMAKVYRGREGLLEFWRDWVAVWESIEFKSLKPDDHGDHVIVEVEQCNRGRTSGVDVVFRYFQTFTIRDGKLAASHMARTHDDALALLG
jgi:ketosteroid isomerase-like protein